MPCTSFSCNPLVLYCSPVDMVVRYGWRKALYNLMIKAWGFSASVSLVCDLYKLFLSAFLSPQLKWDGKSEGAWSLGIALPPSWGTALIELFPLAELAWLWRCSESISSDFCPSSYLRQEEEFFFLALQGESLVGLEIKSTQLWASLPECSPHTHAVHSLQFVTIAM